MRSPRHVDLGEVIRFGLLPNLARLAKIWSRGQVAILFFRLNAQAPQKWARELGWNEAPVHLARFTQQARARFVNAIDAVAVKSGAVSAWLRRNGGQRVFVMLEGGTLCLNVDEAEGVRLEPGT